MAKPTKFKAAPVRVKSGSTDFPFGASLSWHRRANGKRRGKPGGS